MLIVKLPQSVRVYGIKMLRDVPCFYDTLAWREIKEYKNFIFNSPAAQICGQLMNAKTINFFFDAIFVRSPGTKI